jgi:iron complex outermembrane recepter protein
MGSKRYLQFAVRSALATAAATAVVPVSLSQTAPAAAPAQPTVEEVVVTGSRLQLAPNDVSISPITTVTSLDIQKTGLVRVEDVLNMLPSVVAEQSSGEAVDATGTATVSLRGLGSQRTLVLVDGFRLSPGAALGAASQPDLNQIPAQLIERVDVLTGGASSVYGADAVAGVVNFILNTHYEGVQFDGTYGFAHHSNDNQTILADLAANDDTLPASSVNAGYNKTASVVAGANFDDGKGNATTYFTYLNTAPVVGTQYDYAACTLDTPGTLPGPGKPFCGGSSSSATGRFLEFGKVGTSAFTTLADQTVDKNTGAFRAYNAATDSYNYGALSYLQREAERYTAGSFVHFDINDKTNVYSEFMFARNTSTAQYGSSGLFFGQQVISCLNPLLTAQELSILCSPSNIAANQATYGPANAAGNPKGGNPEVTGENILLYMARRSVESGARTDNYTSNAFHEVLGVKGEWGDAWSYNGYGQIGVTTMGDDQGGYLGLPEMNNALNVVKDPTTGQPVCASVLNGADPNCVPWNIWVPHGVTQAQLNYLEVPSTYTITAKEDIAHADITGDLGKYGVTVPTATSGMSVNFGAEYRQERYDLSPDFVFENGYASGGDGAVSPIDGAFHVAEAFTEFRLPIFNNKPGAYELAFEGGYRYSSYNSGFNTNTFKLGLEWAPIEDVRFRGGYNRAVRAPNIGELFSPAAVGPGGNPDPCWGPAVGGLVQGHSLAFCENTGVTPNEFGHIIANPAAEVNVSDGGNISLKPEIADTYTVGFVLHPQALPQLVMSVDFYAIKITDTIESLNTTTVLDECGATGLASLCDLVHRGAGGSLWFNNSEYVNTDEENIGAVSTRGIDVTGHYVLDLRAMGKLGFALTGTEVINFVTQPVENVRGSYDCAGYFGSTCGEPTPHWRHVFTTDWATPWQQLDLTARWRYIGAVDTDRSSSNPLLASTYYPGTAHIGSYSYFDLSASIPVANSGVSIRMGVNNVMDKPPPIVLNGNYSDCPAICNDNTWVGTYDTLGRYMYGEVSAKF